MEIPNLVRERLGDESVEATVSLGDEDLVCVTPTRTILYRGEGLLSDESVAVYSHDVERLDVSQGRRNTKFVLEYVDGTSEFKVPNDRAETLLKLLLQGVLRVAGVADDEESVTGVFQFSELTLVVTEARLVKHVGAPVFDSDFEVFDYADVTGLDFEEGSVATQIVLTVDGRPERIKAPTDQAPRVRQTLTQTLCSYYDVGSLDELADKFAAEAESSGMAADPEDDSSEDLALDDGISPLVGTADEESEATAGESSRQANTGSASPAAESGSADTATTTDPDGSRSQPPADEKTDVEAIEEQLSTLVEAVQRQNDLLRTHNERLAAHDEKIDQLIEELRRGR